MSEIPKGLAYLINSPSAYSDFVRVDYPPMVGRIIYPEETYRDLGYPLGKSVKGLTKWVKRAYAKNSWRIIRRNFRRNPPK